MRNFKSVILVSLLICGFIFIQISGCALVDVRTDHFSENYYNQFKKIIESTSVSVMIIAYYDGPESLQGPKKGKIRSGYGRGFIFNKDHSLVTNYHVISADAVKTVSISKRFGFQIVSTQMPWTIKKARYFIIKNCAELNRVRVELSAYIEKKSQLYLDTRNNGTGGYLACVSEEDFDNFFIENKDKLSNIFEFNIATGKDGANEDSAAIYIKKIEDNPEKYNLLFRGDKAKDFAVVRLSGLDGKFDYVRPENIAKSELRIGQKIYMWGAPRAVIEQLYVGIIANTRFYDKDSINNIEINNGAAKDGSAKTKSGTDEKSRYIHIDYHGLTNFPIIPGSSGSPLFYINKKGKLKIIGIAAFCFPAPPFSAGYGYVKIRYVLPPKNFPPEANQPQPYNNSR